MKTPRPDDTVAATLAERYRSAAHVLIGYRDRVFPKGSVVYVDCDRYRGPGIAARDSACPPDQLPVLLGNGNTWWYPIERCYEASQDGEAK